MKRLLKACFLITCAVLCKANAASYDCNQTLTAIEKMICSDSYLSEMDSELALAYDKARKGLLNRDALKADQIHWLKAVRNKCRDIECLRNAYVSRLQELRHSSAATVMDELNQTCRNTASQKIEIFTTIAKNDPDLVDSTFSMGGGICDAINNMKIESKDLNGDGQPELLVNLYFSCGAQNCPLFVFQETGGRYSTLLSGTGLGIDVMSSATNGYYDLSIKAHDSAVSYEESTYNYNGHEYKQKECLFYRQIDDGRQVRERCAAADLAEPNKGVSVQIPRIPVEESLVIQTRSGDVVVYNFFIYRETKLLGENEYAKAVIRDTPEYSIQYTILDQRFLISLNGGNVREARAQGERVLAEKLRIPPAEMCKLTVAVAVSEDVDWNAAGHDYGLSFCSNGKPMPQATAGLQGAGRAAAPAADTRQPPEASSSPGSGSATPAHAEDMAQPGHPGWQAANGTGCLVWNSEPGDRDPSMHDFDKIRQGLEKVTWSGPCEGGRASGQGELVWRSGRGRELARYVGEMREGKMNGHGRFSQNDFEGSEKFWYEGELRDDEFHGHGKLGLVNPGPEFFQSMEGDFVGSDKIDGPARVLWGNGDRYEGEFVLGVTRAAQNGRGKMTKANGDWYEGEWSGGFADGEGEAKIGDKKYSGVWARGCLRSTEQRAAWDVPRHECP
jgi:uncharacterized protein